MEARLESESGYLIRTTRRSYRPIPLAIRAHKRVHDGHAGDWNEWQAELQVREMPDIRSEPVTSQPESDRAIRIDTSERPKAKPASSKRRMAALKAWETRRARQSAEQRKK